MVEHTAEEMRKYADGKKERDRKIEEEARIKRENNIKYVIMKLIVTSAKDGRKQLKIEAKQLLKNHEDESKTEFLEYEDFEWIQLWLESLGYVIEVVSGMSRVLDCYSYYNLQNPFDVIPGAEMTISWKGE